ncbi:hypothetical protein [Algisphaera agarilytica]|uniref:Outer membrane lipoprotein-sorting protein n=1 Tax=Algisphaera agarilytica TaxID=1385975 RepID=A0A7X0H7H6_9BACT|nr:hypothetical protein [Algisphaera agarilytica]MBB6429546.1 hypothetical protein [Algisphaera agarilytica]
MNLSHTLSSVTSRFAAGLAMAAVASFPGSPVMAEEPDRLAPIRATLDAHGGLDTWQQQGTLTYVLTGFPLSGPMSQPNTSTIDLRSRANRIDGQGFTVGWNGEQAWSTGEPNSSGLPSRFVTLGSFYFLGMPFVFADPGTVITERVDVEFEGQTYRSVGVGYEQGIGSTAEDDYVLLIDPESDRLFAIHHSVTETGVERVTWVFNDWQEQDGLFAPARLTFYAGWNPDDPGQGAVTEVSELDFRTQRPNANIYRVPADATIDQLAE